MGETVMLCAMVDHMRSAQLSYAAQTLKPSGIDHIPDHFQIDMDIAMDRIPQYFRLIGLFKYHRSFLLQQDNCLRQYAFLSSDITQTFSPCCFYGDL